VSVVGVALDGTKSTPEETKVEVKDVQSGALKMSLTWDNLDDLDLYVKPPTGNAIYYGNPTVGNGHLDLDANAACSSNVGVNNENIYFEALENGDYEIYVLVWGKCPSSNPGANFTVRTIANGQVIINERKRANDSADNNAEVYRKKIRVQGSSVSVVN
jgi:uncharacterized protein YfaP (DUF2135 family)